MLRSFRACSGVEVDQGLLRGTVVHVLFRRPLPVNHIAPADAHQKIVTAAGSPQDLIGARGCWTERVGFLKTLNHRMGVRGTSQDGSCHEMHETSRESEEGVSDQT